MDSAEHMEPRTYSVPEAARILGICRAAAYAAARTGELPSIRIGKRVVVPKATLDEMIANPRGSKDSNGR